MMKDRARITIGRAHHAASEVGGEGLTGYEGEAEEQRQDGNWLGAAHGVSGTARMALILLDSGRNGECGPSH